MRKVAIAVLALAVVFGMSMGVMADDLADEEVEFTIDVEEHAILEVPEDSIKLTIEDLEDNPEESLGKINVAANTAVTTEVKMEFDKLGKLDEDDLWDGDNEDWIISPNIHAEYEGSHADGWADLENGFVLDDITLESNGEKSQEYYFETNINEEADWFKFDADDSVEGKLIFTVSADQ